MKKKIALLILAIVCALCCAFGLVACDGSKCEHKYNTEHDDNYHWYECEKCSDIEHREGHNTSGTNGECTVCHYKKSSAENPPEPHGHVWATSLTHDETHHWYACTVTGCTEKNEKSVHDTASGKCVCGYVKGGTIDPPDGPVVPDTGDDSFNNVSLSANGVLSWNKIKGATKYVLKVTYAAQSDPTEYTIDKTKNSVNLNELRNEGFPAGKSSAEILVYENVKVEIDGQTGYQEVLMTDVKESFRIVKSNGSFSLVRLSYSDTNIKLDGFYAEKQTIGNKSVYLYEQVLKDNKPMTLKIKNYVQAADTDHTVYFYKSEAGRNSGDSSDIWNSAELQMGYPQVAHGANFYYVRVFNKTTEQTADYDLCVYGLYTLTVKRLDVSFTETDGLRDYTYTPIGDDLKYTEMDIIPQEVLYGGVDGGKLARTANYKTVEKEDLTVIADSAELSYYFYDEATVRADCRTYAKWSETYNLNEYTQGWSLSCNYDKATGMVTLPDILIGKKVISANFYYSDISALVVEEGAETLTATFTDCWKLFDIFLPSTITDMPKNAFKGVNSEVVVHCAFERSATNAFPLYWDYDVNKKVATEFGITVPENALTISNGLVFSECENEGELAVSSAFSSFDGEIPDELSFNGKTYKITQIVSIGSVEALIIGKNINYIADGALNNVKNISLASGNAFYTLDNGILYSKDYTSIIFIADKTVTQLTVDGRVQSIAFGLLSGFDLLESLTIPFTGATLNGTENTHFGYIFGASDYLQNEFVVPSGLRTITVTGGNKTDDYAFYGCKYVESITLPQTVQTIGNSAFYSCSALTEFTIPDSVTELGDNAFYGCNNLTSVYVNNLSHWGGIDFKSARANPLNNGNVQLYAGDDEVTDLGTAEDLSRINAYAFYGYKGFTALTVPDTVTYIGLAAFGRCQLTEITVPFVGEAETDTENNYLSYIFGASDRTSSIWSYVPQSLRKITVTKSNDIGEYAFYYFQYVTEIILPDDVKNIGSFAFYDCRALTTFDIPDGVKEIGSYAFCECSSLTTVNLPDELESIGSYAFNNCSLLTTVNLPDGLESIEQYAFAKCGKITEITIPAGVAFIGSNAFEECRLLSTVNWNATACSSSSSQIFLNCYKLTNVNVGDNVTVIPDSAFYSSGSITKITLGNAVTSIGAYAFYNCSALSDVTIPDGVTEVGREAFHKTAWLNNQPDGLVYAGKVAYTYKGEMPSGTSIILADGTNSIGAYAFRNCEGLTSITIPDSLTSIGVYAFEGCNSLASITVDANNPDYASQDGILYNKAKTQIVCVPVSIAGEIRIPDGITCINSGEFSGCAYLSGIIIPDSVTSIGMSAFEGCNSLESITIPFVGLSKDDIYRNNLYHIFGSNSSSVPSTLKTVIITGGETIGSDAFYGCNSITSITIPNSVTSIGSSAFSGCISLTEIVIPDSVTSIGSSAFGGCRSLTSITIPFVGENKDSSSRSRFYHIFGSSSANVPSTLKTVIITGGDTIYESAFNGCDSITEIIIPDTVTVISTRVFQNCSSLTDITFNGTKEQWEAIQKGYLWNDKTGNYTVHCKDGDITKS